LDASFEVHLARHLPDCGFYMPIVLIFYENQDRVLWATRANSSHSFSYTIYMEEYYPSSGKIACNAQQFPVLGFAKDIP
jgi:hypothetical protein